MSWVVSDLGRCLIDLIYSYRYAHQNPIRAANGFADGYDVFDGEQHIGRILWTHAVAGGGQNSIF